MPSLRKSSPTSGGLRGQVSALSFTLRGEGGAAGLAQGTVPWRGSGELISPGIVSKGEGQGECVASSVLFFQVFLSGRRVQWFTVVLLWVRVCHRLVLASVTGLVTPLLYKSTVRSKFPSPMFLNLCFVCSSRASLWGRSNLTFPISAVTGTVPGMWRRGEEDEWAVFLGRRVAGWDESVGWFFSLSLVSCSFILQEGNTRTWLFHAALLWSPCSLMFSCTTQQSSTHLKPLIWMVKWLHCWEQAQLLTPYDQDMLQRRLVHLNVNKILPFPLCSSFKWCWSPAVWGGSSYTGQLCSARVLLCIGALEKAWCCNSLLNKWCCLPWPALLPAVTPVSLGYIHKWEWFLTLQNLSISRALLC